MCSSRMNAVGGYCYNPARNTTFSSSNQPKSGIVAENAAIPLLQAAQRDNSCISYNNSPERPGIREPKLYYLQHFRNGGWDFHSCPAKEPWIGWLFGSLLGSLLGSFVFCLLGSFVGSLLGSLLTCLVSRLLAWRLQSYKCGRNRSFIFSSLLFILKLTVMELIAVNYG